MSNNLYITRTTAHAFAHSVEKATRSPTRYDSVAIFDSDKGSSYRAVACPTRVLRCVIPHQ